MKVFLIPSWHPTPDKPNWCNWIKPHIQLAKSVAEEVIILQVDQETNKSSDEIIELSKNHYYITSGEPKNRFHRNFFTYKKSLKKYNAKIEKLYQFAVRVHGKPDLIHAHVSMPAGYGAASLGSQHSIPVIVTEHFSGFFWDHKFPWRIGSYYFEMRSKINGFYTVSPGFKTEVENKTKIKVDDVFPNPINTELFSPEPYKNEENIIKFATTGNFGLRKGTDVLLKAFQSLPKSINWQLTIVGKRDSQNAFWNDLLNLLPQERLKLVEAVPQTGLREIYSQNDIFIVSSRIETANVSMLEAMACGCYVITSTINAPETLLTPEVATNYDNTAEGLRKAILSISQTKNLPARKDLRQFVLENYSREQLKPKLSGIYQSFVNTGGISKIKN
ncbi:glycosyltransferase family 4 protein [Salinimicrobium gaetbulicola]|uniref:Glycosyltransferase family 4 protein n=1 Tax=Salinimicrobium gaetbulicola TaxID=999702 RepID=A0ABW3IF04_9FLAO